MKTIIISFDKFKNAENAVPSVREALKELADGGRLIFEKGIYHFYEAGTYEAFFAPSNNGAGIKKVAFPILDCKNITIDGNDSTFVFHGNTFPFVVCDSENVAIKNIILTTYLPPYALLKISEKNESEFLCEIDGDRYPFSVNENGNLIFKTESEDINTKNCKLSMHALERTVIRYLFAGVTTAEKEGLAAPYVNCDASVLKKDGKTFIKFSYRDDPNPNSEKCVYDKGESIVINLEEDRRRDVFFLVDSESILISHIIIHRGGGMGVIAQLCRNIEIDSITASPNGNNKGSDCNPVSLTADILHFVNCNGNINIHDCVFESSLDDACNIHGVYSEVAEVGNNYIDVEYKHPQQNYLNLYKSGDSITVIDNKTLDIIGKLTVVSCSFSDDKGMLQRIVCDKIPAGTKNGFFVESADRMPAIFIHGNKCRNIPHWRLSGAGGIRVENNEYDDCNIPVYAFDLAEYWFESGRISELVIKNNLFRNTRFQLGSIYTGVSGFDHAEMPKIHGSITVEGNTFVGIKDSPYSISAFKNAVIDNNTFDGKKQ